MKVKTSVLLFDVHLTDKSNPTYEIAKKFVAAIEPDEVVLGGDYMDCSSLSHWDMDKRLLMEGKRYQLECDRANKELDFLQRYSKKVTYLEGNHERWCVQYAERHPEMSGLIEIPLKLKLEERDIAWHEMNSLYQMGNLYVTHGMYVNQYNAMKHLIKLGCNVVYGHGHSAQSAQMNMKMQDPYMAWAIGCLCSHSAHYLKGMPANWIDQFAVVYTDTKTDNFSLYPVNIIEGEIIWNGRIFK